MQIKSSLLISFMLLVLSAFQVISHLGNEKVSVLFIMFSIVGIFSLIIFLILIMDVSRKDFIAVEGQVVSRHRNQVWVKLQNGKHKSSVISANQNPESFTEGQPVKLKLGKRSKMVHRIEILAE
ncbi:hypothetical protein [Saccharibacillus sp. JS10]|uniref:hypothetical protein n=1 Tax=Saccharibacillus sp. JS10 TaxID=2950552 RepID=UPI002108875D|nr:hypothetical protein [Saccharibacillus sp. JS10]MCQ4085540.1 hypothetical protein [Saccharibacillus sp. JS10]